MIKNSNEFVEITKEKIKIFCNEYYDGIGREISINGVYIVNYTDTPYKIRGVFDTIIPDGIIYDVEYNKANRILIIDAYKTNKNATSHIKEIKYDFKGDNDVKIK